MNDPRETLPGAMAVIERGMAEGLHIGAQVYLSLNGSELASFAVGEARPGVPMTTDTMMLWWSSTKPTAAVAIGQQWEQGRLDIDDPITSFIPEFGVGGKERITLRHVLTHTGGFRLVDRAPNGGTTAFSRDWDEIIAQICAAPLDEGWTPGLTAGYHPSSGHFILGEIVRRLDGRPYQQYVREAIYEPLGMADCWVGMPADRFRAYGERIGWMHDTKQSPPVPVPGVDSEAAVGRSVPGGGGRGPMRELARLYEMLLFRGQRDGVRLLSPQAVEAITAKHRVGLPDLTLGGKPSWGLSISVDSISCGRHRSRRVFSHGGAESSLGFADPENGLAGAVVFNGMPGGPRHYARMSAFTTAVYEDLGLADPAATGREEDHSQTTGLT